MPIGAVTGEMGTAGAGGMALPSIRNAADAAKAFEAMMLKQLLSSMSKPIFGGGDEEGAGIGGSGFEGQLYGEMFAEAMANQASGKLGLSDMITKSLGVDGEQSKPLAALNGIFRGLSAYKQAAQQAALTAPALAPGMPDPAAAASTMPTVEAPSAPVRMPHVTMTVSGEGAAPANPYLATAAAPLATPGHAERWGKDGALLPRDLNANILTDSADGKSAVFNVLDANGYEGHPKCNVFAFELLQRAGYAVPVSARAHGWGYPGADTVAELAGTDKVQSWADNRSQLPQESLDAIAQSSRPLLLASSAEGEVAGHMAVADRVHRIQRDSAGNIAAIEYSGWEAGPNKAGYGRHVWRAYGVPGQGRGGLSRIEVLEPRTAAEVGGYHAMRTGLPGASIQDRSLQLTMSSQGLNITTEENR